MRSDPLETMMVIASFGVMAAIFLILSAMILAPNFFVG